MIGRFIAVLFLAREIAHRFHLAANGPGSYARHQALGSFYESVVELADRLAECAQGRMGLFEIPYIGNLFPADDALASMREQLAWIELNRFEAVPATDTALQNLIDEIVAEYLATIYKLANLK